MTDTNFFDNPEKVDILLKQAFGFPSTSENKQWYEETAVNYNNYLNGEDLFLDVIPQIPDFDNSGIVRSANEFGLQTSTFLSYNNNVNSKSLCSIVDDSTGTVRRFQNVILEQCPQLGSDAGASWFKLDNSNNNILKDAFQFNYKQYSINGITYQPYLYSLYTQNSFNSSSPNLPFGQKGGNWFFDIKSGILFFSDFINFSNGVQTNPNFQINTTNNFPVLSFYKYIGRKGISSFIPTLSNNLNILQITGTSLTQGLSDEIIESTNYQIINDLSLTLVSLKDNSQYKILLNFNYLSSNYYDTLLKVAMCYKINNGPEIIVGEYLLGNENTSFKYDFFSNNFYQNITSSIGNNINFYIKAKIHTENLTNYSSIDDIYKPKIILSSLGNILNIEEVNN